MDQLPAEMIEIVFEFMPHQDRKTGVLLNSRWRKAGEAAHLWDWVSLPRVENDLSRTRVIQMLNSRRLAGAKEIAIKAGSLSNDLLQAVALHKGLRQIEIWGYPLPTGVDIQLLVEALTKTDSLDLQKCSLPTQVIIAMLTKVAAGCSLKEFYLHEEDKEKTLSEAWRSRLADRILNQPTFEMPTALLTSAFTRLTKVHLTRVLLTNSQMGALLEKISQVNSSLTNLSLVRYRSLKGPGRLNLLHLVNLEEVRLVDNHFIWEDLIDFLAALSLLTKLKNLDLENRYLPNKEEEDNDNDNDNHAAGGDDDNDDDGDDDNDDDNNEENEMMAKAINFLEGAKIRIPCEVCF